MYDLMGRTILVTGASSGIGASMAKLFAREGARLILCARREERLERLAEEIRAAHDADVLVHPLDVRDRKAVDLLMAKLPEGWRSIDVLVNNAGLSRGLEPFPKNDPEDWDEMVATNVSGLLHMTRQILPGMLSRRRGDIVNIGSTASHEVYPGGTVYCATKHAVDAITRWLRMDLADTPLRVIQVSPGMTETEFSLVRFKGDRPRADKVYEGMQPLTGDDVAEAVFYALTRPAHVQVGEIVLWPTSQGSSTVVHRSAEQESTPPHESTWKSYYELKE